MSDRRHGTIREMRVPCAILVSLGVLAARGDAQPSMTAPSTPPPTGEVELRDPSRARVMSLAIPLLTMGASLAVMNGNEETATGIGLPLFLAGAVMGPSTGIWYAGHQGGKGMLARSAALGVIGMGIAAHIGSTQHGDSYPNSRSEEVAAVLIAGGIVGWTASWIYDVREAGRIVERGNRARNALVVPAVISSASGGRMPGAMLTGTFE